MKGSNELRYARMLRGLEKRRAALPIKDPGTWINGMVSLTKPDLHQASHVIPSILFSEPGSYCMDECIRKITSEGDRGWHCAAGHVLHAICGVYTNLCNYVFHHPVDLPPQKTIGSVIEDLQQAMLFYMTCVVTDMNTSQNSAVYAYLDCLNSMTITVNELLTLQIISQLVNAVSANDRIYGEIYECVTASFYNLRTHSCARTDVRKIISARVPKKEQFITATNISAFDFNAYCESCDDDDVNDELFACLKKWLLLQPFDFISVNPENIHTMDDFVNAFPTNTALLRASGIITTPMNHI